MAEYNYCLAHKIGVGYLNRHCSLALILGNVKETFHMSQKEIEMYATSDIR